MVYGTSEYRGGGYPEGAREETGKAGNFSIQRIGKTEFFNYFIRDIPMTGAAVTKQLPIEFPHRILSIKLFHGDATKAASVVSMSATFEIPANSVSEFPYWQDKLWEDTTITCARKTRVFDENEGGVFGARFWRLSLNTTNGHYVTVMITVQRLGRM